MGPFPKPFPTRRAFSVFLGAKSYLKFGIYTGQWQSGAGILLLSLEVHSGPAPIFFIFEMGHRYLALLARGQGLRLIHLWGPRPASGAC